MSDEYLMRLTEEQADLMHRALEFYARIGIGQLEEVLAHPAVSHWNKMTARSPEDARAMIAQLKGELLGLSASASYSIYSEEVPDAMRVAWDIRNVIRHKLASERADHEPVREFSPLTGVALDTPTQSGSWALPVIENVTQLEGDVDALKQTSTDLQQRLAVVLAKLGGK